MDGEGGVSDGRGVESGCGADAAGVEWWGGPRRVGGGAAGPPRVLLEPKIVPARTRELDRARAAKKAAKNAAAAADAGSSEPPPTLQTEGRSPLWVWAHCPHLSGQCGLGARRSVHSPLRCGPPAPLSVDSVGLRPHSQWTVGASSPTGRGIHSGCGPPAPLPVDSVGRQRPLWLSGQWSTPTV